jgi:hypothetical protein
MEKSYINYASKKSGKSELQCLFMLDVGKVTYMKLMGQTYFKRLVSKHWIYWCSIIFSSLSRLATHVMFIFYIHGKNNLHM